MNVYKKFMLGCCAICLALMTGCATVPRSAVSYESLEDLCRQFNIGFSYDPVVRSVIISQNSTRIFLLVDSAVVSIGNERILLDAPAIMRRNTVYVPEDFRQKILCRIDQRLCAAVVMPKNFTVVIDPGHGGKDPGATGAYYLKEKDVVLDIAGRVMQQLRQYGFDVYMTRTSDQFISLEGRAEYATEKGADLFISIHANASRSSQAHGFEVWAPRVLTYNDFQEAPRQKNNQIAFRRLNMEHRNDYLQKTLEDMMYQHKHVESLNLAAEISKSCARGISFRNRGIKQSGFFVLRNTLVPSALVEVGFVSNRREADWLKNSSYRQKMAEMIAQGIKNYVQSL